MEKALPLVEYKIEVYREKYDDGSTEGRIKFVNTMAEVLSGIDNSVEMELYIKKIANEYGLTRDSLYAEVIKKRKTGNKKIRVTANFAENGKDSIRDGYAGSKNLLHDEMMLIAVLSVDNSVYEYVKGILSVNDFTCETVKRVAETIFEKLEKKNRVVPAEVLNILDKGDAEILAAIIEKECNFDENKKPVDIVRKIKKNKLESRRKEIKKQLENTDNSGKGEVWRLIQELNAITMEIAKI